MFSVVLTKGYSEVPYTKPVTSNEPGLILLLLDQSGSMLDPFGSASLEEGAISKAVILMRTVNRLFRELVEANVGGTGLKDRFALGVIAYGGSTVESGFMGALAGKELATLTEIANNPLRMDIVKKKLPDGDGGILEIEQEVPVWVDSKASGSTPMVAALKRGYEVAAAWAAGHKGSFPPIILNITDGQATDVAANGTIEAAVELIKSTATDDGNALLFNCHLSSDQSPERLFLSDEQSLTDDFARTLFRASSVLPAPCLAEARKQNYNLPQGARGFVFNASAVALTAFINIGTPTGGDL